MEETLNSLDYAYRDKNIKNRPEVNQKVIKSAMIKDLYAEIDRLKQELNVAREKNGIYIPRDRYLSEAAAKKTMAEKLELMELDLEFKDKGFAVPKEAQEKVSKFSFHGQPTELKHGSVVITAITSCTNISNPSVMTMNKMDRCFQEKFDFLMQSCFLFSKFDYFFCFYIDINVSFHDQIHF